MYSVFRIMLSVEYLEDNCHNTPFHETRSSTSGRCKIIFCIYVCTMYNLAILKNNSPEKCV